MRDTLVQGGIGMPDRDYYLKNDAAWPASAPNISST
jgi:predicted metalloendopeptidase